MSKSIAAGVAAFVAGIGTMLLGGQILPIFAWYGQAAAAAIASAVWMLVGLHVAPRSRVVAGGLFSSGAVLMWWWSRGVVHSVSPYYGLTTFAAAIVAAGGAYLWFEVKHSGHPGDPAVLSLVFTTVLIGRSLLSEAPGLDRTLRMGVGDEVRVGTVATEDGSRFIWTPSSVTEIPPNNSIELDPGSGFVSGNDFVRISSDSERSRVCALFDDQDREDLAEEVRDQTTPGIFSTLPPGGRSCLSGEVWELVERQGNALSNQRGFTQRVRVLAFAAGPPAF